MNKIALLVGVSDYRAGFNSLPGVLKNVTAMQHVLQHPQIGGFASVKTLLNPDQQVMAEAIETLFCERQSDELVLFYFSGYGIQDDNGKLYLAGSSSRKNDRNKLVKSSALPATFVQEIMNESQAQHQFVILDACWSSTVSDSDTHFVDIASQLGATGRVILTSTTSTFPYFQDSEAQSVYTRYLVEGMTGAADLNNDGAILIHELHHYARRKVQTVLPVIQPQMYGREHDQQITLAQTAIDDPKYQYRQTAERYVEGGELSLVGRSILDVLRASLELEPEAAASIEAEVLQPYREYQTKLQRYVQELVEVIRREAGWNEVARYRARQLQRLLGLLDEDVAAHIAQISDQISTLQAHEPSGVTGLVDSSPASSQGKIAATTSVGNSMPTVILAPQTPAKINSSNSNHLHLVLADRKSWLLMGGGIVVAALTLTSVIFGLRQSQTSQQLKAINALAQKRSYEKCITVAKTISKSSTSYIDAQMLLKQCEAGVNWQNTQVQTLGGHSDMIWSVAFSPNGQIASGSSDDTIKLWKLGSGELLRTLSGHSNTVWSVAFSPDGQTLASGSSDDTIKLWKLGSGELLRTLSGHSDAVRSVAFSPDGQTLASGSSDNTIKIWQRSSGKLLRTLSGHSGTVRSIAFSSDGQTLASGSSDNTIKIWALGSGRLLRTLSGHTDRVISIALSPDGQTLVSGSVDKTIKMWNVASGKLRRTLAGNSYWVNAVAISPTGRVFASGIGDSIKIWDLNTAQLLYSMPGNSSDITSIAFSSDGNRLAFGTQGKTITILWR